MLYWTGLLSMNERALYFTTSCCSLQQLMAKWTWPRIPYMLLYIKAFVESLPCQHPPCFWREPHSGLFLVTEFHYHILKKKITEKKFKKKKRAFIAWKQLKLGRRSACNACSTASKRSGGVWFSCDTFLEVFFCKGFGVRTVRRKQTGRADSWHFTQL